MKMNAEKRKLIEQFYSITSNYEKKEDQLINIIGNIESPYIEAVDKFHGFAMDCLAELICGSDNELQSRFFWFTYDNQRGEQKAFVILDNKKRKMETIDDLCDLLEATVVNFFREYNS